MRCEKNMAVPLERYCYVPCDAALPDPNSGSETRVRVPRKAIAGVQPIMGLAMERAASNDDPIKDIPFFSRLPADRCEILKQHMTICRFTAGESIIEEGTANPGRLYIVLEGEAALCNRGRDFTTHALADYEIARRQKDEIFGAISFLDRKSFSSSARAKTPLIVAVLDFSQVELSAESRKLRAYVVGELRRELANELRHSIANRVGSLQQEAEFARYKNAVGRIVVTTLSLLSVYTLLLSILPQFMLALTVNFAISPFIIILFAAVMGFMSLHSVKAQITRELYPNITQSRGARFEETP
jgi:CRP-like cAMP-binding protein